MTSLFHYTDIGAASSIIQNGALWLTHLRYLNDREELNEGIKFLTEWFELQELIGYSDQHKEKAFEFFKGAFKAHTRFGYKRMPLFCCSLSKEGDLLSQWRGYGNIAVEFDRAALESELNLFDCVYSKPDKENLAGTLCEGVHDALSSCLEKQGSISVDALGAYTDILTASARFKDASFAEEAEVRIVHTEPLDSGEVRFRVRGNYLVPYVVKGIPHTAIRSIRVGPSANQQLVADSLNDLVNAVGDSTIPIVKSEIPFRA
ncbi:DUF2971 domain-containing protein [Metapseudomonas otitidis]|uniref:DUF2971 domain-containing protein n=1 Tax=Metapseudomonas otitidis TaxID=319939 RepID=UPI00253FB6B0|nr:DUF2971 domain-containing protein [Pseudomonas otitidis]WIF69707.1 DUF2971 domain-containing protein [Pseudomonas otitidis]